MRRRFTALACAVTGVALSTGGLPLVQGAQAAYTDAVPATATFQTRTVPAMSAVTCAASSPATSPLNWTAVTGVTGYLVTRPNLTTVLLASTATSYSAGGLSLGAYTVTPVIGTWSSGAPRTVVVIVVALLTTC